MNKKKMMKWVSIIVTIAALLFLFQAIDLKEFFNIQKELSVMTLSFALVAYFWSLFSKTVRFFFILNRLSPQKITLLHLLPIVLIHNFYNRVLPLRTGEASLILLLKSKLNYDIKKGVFGLLLARVYDGFSILFCLLISLSFLKFNEYQYNIMILAFFLFLAILFLLTKASRLISIINWVLKTVFKTTSLKNTLRIKKINDNLTKIREHIEKMSRPIDILTFTLISLSIWLSIYLLFFIMLVGYNLIPFSIQGYWQVVAGSTISIITFYLPINFLSGPMELGWTLGFVLQGMEKQIALNSGFGINWFVHILSSLFALSAFFGMGVKKIFCSQYKVTGKK